MKDDSNRSLRRVNRKSRSAADRTVEVDSSAFFAEDPSPTPPPRKKPGSSAPRRSGAPAQAAAARPSAFGRILLPVQGILSAASLVQLWRTQMLPVLYLVILAALLFLLWLLVKRCQEYNVPGKVSRVFSVFLCACMALGCVWAQQGLTALDNMTNGLLTGAEANKITKEPFVIYLSGVDTRGELTEKARSDVNILAVVNPTTKQILLVNTPRDYYLPLARNGELDKLTHAGLYGIDESMKVLGNLYGVQADYYVRVNFAGLVKIVDALGGVDIESDANFSCVPMETPDGNGDYTYQKYSFTKGINHVNGSQALAFARERKAFADGDNRRGQHQMTVIKAIVNKACSSAVLTKYQELLKAASDAFITNMPYADISSLGDMADWNITTYAVSGEGSTEYCYALGDKAWVMIKDSSKVNTAKNMIQQVINGEVPTTSSSDSN